VWSQQGSKLVGTGAVGAAYQGISVALAADGNTAIVGGYTDNSGAGAAWVFSASACAWSAVPVANFTFSPSVPRAGHFVIFTDQSSNGPTSWLWDFGDGTNSGATPRTVPSVAHTYSAAGTYTVSMTVSNCRGSNADVGLGGLGVFQKQITVSPPCSAVAITAQPHGQSVQSGHTATLSVTTTGTTPVSYQWYQGTSGDTSSPVGSDSNSYTTPALTTTGTYWVRVTNPCGTANSTAATITVSQFPVRRIKRFLKARPSL
jgi:PKD repeat protein